MDILVEGDKQTLTQTVSGDYTGRFNYFTAKNSKSDSRIIDFTMEDTDAVYADGITTFTFELLPSDTALVTKTPVFADIVSVNKSDSTDSVTVWNDIVAVEKTVRDDQDEATAETSTVTILDPSDFDDGDMLKKDDASGSFIAVNVAERRTDLGLPAYSYRAKWYQVSTLDPGLVSEYVNTFDDDAFTSFVRTSEGVYTMSGFHADLPSGTIMDIRISNADNDGTKYMTTDVSGADIIVRVFNRSDDTVSDGLWRAVIEINGWDI